LVLVPSDSCYVAITLIGLFPFHGIPVLNVALGVPPGRRHREPRAAAPGAIDPAGEPLADDPQAAPEPGPAAAGDPDANPAV